jgi:hypothetical protein
VAEPVRRKDAGQSARKIVKNRLKIRFMSGFAIL